eukprot:CAMPEP_0181277874 /NCGR_PEP_ID=MMETSP1097-20121128/11379_1 /TAXON_ID=35684 /ORGANISM="Pseudopedinella elastica, Strain CCMP716" /LENGTH=72 /DNA_ID=CAMNT_0023379823 /DNA_START=31 /DNA_END=249 /DNA_ORIENTATION=-
MQSADFQLSRIQLLHVLHQAHDLWEILRQAVYRCSQAALRQMTDQRTTDRWRRQPPHQRRRHRKGYGAQERE